MALLGVKIKGGRPDRFSRVIIVWLWRWFLDIRLAHELPWDNYKHLTARSLRTKDGWLVYADVPHIAHFRIQCHPALKNRREVSA